MKRKIIKFLVNSRIKRVSKVYNNKISNIRGAEKKADDGLISLHKKKWARLTRYPVNIKWLNAYVNSSKIESPDFVPESIFYTLIEPIVNNNDLSLAYGDKNFYDLVFPHNIFPTTVLRNINGSFYTEDYSHLNINTNELLQRAISKHKGLFVKPAIGSGGGDNVSLFEQSGKVMIDNTGEVLNLSFLNYHLKENYVIQKVLSQHHDLSVFNKTSINTIKVLTWLRPVTGKVEILHCVLRVGAKGKYIDNSRVGGYSIGVKPNGLLNQYATNKAGEHFTEVNGISLLQNHQLPVFEEIKNKAKEISSKFLHFRLLGLDMMVDENQNVRCIEVNHSGNEINFYQLNNGPLFGEFTNEVIEYCLERRQRLFESYSL